MKKIILAQTVLSAFVLIYPARWQTREGSQRIDNKVHTISETLKAFWVTLASVVLGALFLFLALPDRAFLHAMRCGFDQPSVAISKRHYGDQVRLFCFSRPIGYELNRQPYLFDKPSRHRAGSRP